jgi:O-antigen ligase
VKYVLFAIALAGVFPLAIWLRQRRDYVYYAATVLTAMPFVVGLLPRSEIALSGDPIWPGYTIGFEVSIIDLFALAISFALPRSRASVPFKIPFLFYLIAISLSALNAHFTLPSLWYVWQLMRMLFLFVVLVRVCQDERGAKAVMAGFAAGICVEAGLVLWQRFIIHNPHAPGTFFHQNALGFALHVPVLALFGASLSDRKNWKFLLFTFLGIVCDIFTASRASLGLLGVGLVLVLGISLLRHWTARKARILGTAVVCALILVPVVVRTFEIRAQAFGIETDDGRAAMNQGARLMSSAYPFGVGANNFVPVAQREGFYWRAGVAYPNYNISPHNAYWTTLAESGFLGLFGLLLWLSVPLVVAISCGWRNRRDSRADALIGLGVGIFLVAIHSEFEWLLLSQYIQYILAPGIALIGGLAYQLGYWAPAKLGASALSNDRALRNPSMVPKRLVRPASSA